MKRMIMMLMCALIALALTGCMQVSEERGMPQAAPVATQEAAAPQTTSDTAPQTTDAPAPALTDVPEGENAPDEPGLNG